MIRDHRPDFVLIQETKMKKDLVGKISFCSSMEGHAINVEGASGGLLTLFNHKHFQVTTIHNEGNILLCKVFHMYSKDSWFLLNAYTPNTKQERKVYWAKLSSLIQNCNLNKGIIMGDFNTSLFDEEKYGGLALDQDSKMDLSLFINSLALLDVELAGGIFTWSNRHSGSECI